MEYRIEHDSMGDVKVPADRYWGAQTERSRGIFQSVSALRRCPARLSKPSVS